MHAQRKKPHKVIKAYDIEAFTSCCYLFEQKKQQGKVISNTLAFGTKGKLFIYT